MNFTLEYSGAWLLLIAILSIALVAWLYWHRSDRFEWTKRLKAILTVLRWVVTFTLGFLLLEPYFVRLISEEERPKLLLYTDASASIEKSDQQQMHDVFQRLSERLTDKFEVKQMAFASSATRLTDSSNINPLNTDLGAVMESINQDYYGENIGAVVIGSDGIINQGKDPRYVGLKSNARVYSLLLGDTSIRPDVELSQVLSNKLAFLNNDFEVKARIAARKLKGERIEVRLMRNGKVLKTEEIRIDANAFSTELSFMLKADRIGVNEYIVQASVLEAETNQTNNEAATYIEVLDNRTRVQILAHAPHPDVYAIKRAIEKSEQYEVEVKLLRNWDQQMEQTDLFITHGLPTGPNDLNLIKPITKSGKQMFVVLSTSVSILHFNALSLGVTVDATSSKMDEVNTVQNEQFNLFNIQPNELIKRFPPLYAPFGDYKFNANHQIALFQRIGTIQTEKPLLAFTENQGVRNGVLLAEGWWKWGMFEAQATQAADWTDRLIQKTVQYLAIKQKRTRLAIEAPQTITEGQEIIFGAEYYNESYELNNNEEVNLQITDSIGNKFAYIFKPAANSYRLAIGSLPPGNYSWNASAVVNGESFGQSGAFSVIQNKAEFVRKVADHGKLEDLSKRTGGKAFNLSDENALIEELQQLETAKPVIHTTREWSSLMDWKVLAFLLVTLIGIEWFVRKFTGYV